MLKMSFARLRGFDDLRLNLYALYPRRRAPGVALYPGLSYFAHSGRSVRASCLGRK
jgi:hypothetical protein